MNELSARTFAPAVLLLAACAAPAASTPDGNAAVETATQTQGAGMPEGTTAGGAADGTTGADSTATGGVDAIPTGDCGKESETVETFPGHPSFKKCCPGLGPVFTMGHLGADGKCLPQPPVASSPAVCRKSCGDGKCDGDENKCNCSDCK